MSEQTTTKGKAKAKADDAKDARLETANADDWRLGKTTDTAGK